MDRGVTTTEVSLRREGRRVHMPLLLHQHHILLFESQGLNNILVFYFFLYLLVFSLVRLLMLMLRRLLALPKTYHYSRFYVLLAADY